jgi:ligand-binding sensor domain-containing protein
MDVRAALAEPVFRRITTGTDASEAFSFAQDADGFIWIGTLRGLIRWDGYRSRVYAVDITNPKALHDAYVTALYVDASGTLWIGTKSSGLARYEPESDSFVSYPVGDAGLPFPAVYAITGDRAGHIWVATGSGEGPGSVDRVDAKTGKIQTLIRSNNDTTRARAVCWSMKTTHYG